MCGLIRLFEVEPPCRLKSPPPRVHSIGASVQPQHSVSEDPRMTGNGHGLSNGSRGRQVVKRLISLLSPRRSPVCVPGRPAVCDHCFLLRPAQLGRQQGDLSHRVLSPWVAADVHGAEWVEPTTTTLEHSISSVPNGRAFERSNPGWSIVIREFDSECIPRPRKCC